MGSGQETPDKREYRRRLAHAQRLTSRALESLGPYRVFMEEDPEVSRNQLRRAGLTRGNLRTSFATRLEALECALAGPLAVLEVMLGERGTLTVREDHLDAHEALCEAWRLVDLFARVGIAEVDGARLESERLGVERFGNGGLRAAFHRARQDLEQRMQRVLEVAVTQWNEIPAGDDWYAYE